MILSLESEPTVGELEATGANSTQANPLARPGVEADCVFRLMAESVDAVAFYLISPCGIISSWGVGASRVQGYKSEEIVGQHFSRLYPAEAVADGLPESELADARMYGRYEDEVPRIRKDGSSFPASVTITALRDVDGTLTGYANVTRDLTEFRQAADQLRIVNARLNAVMNSCSDGIIELGHDWTILYGNRKAAQRLSKFEKGSNFWECFPAMIGTSIEQNLRKSMEERVLVVYENYLATDDLWFRAQASPTEDGISIFFTDVTTEKSLQNQLSLERIMREKRIEALSHMAGGLAHEINNPLAIIHARASDLCSAVTSEEPIEVEEVRTACGSIVHASDRAIRVLRALQGFAREAGSDPMLLTQLSEVLERSIQLLEDRFLRHQVELRTDLAPELPAVLCRETQILQIVINLLNNSLDAVQQSSAKRYVWLSAKPSREGVEIKVADSGPRSDDRLRPALMDPFFAAKTSGAWMGVGLSLSRTIAQEHGGSLILEDAAGDTTFRLTLPLPTALRGTDLRAMEEGRTHAELQ